MGGYVIVELPSEFRMRLVHSRGLTHAADFADGADLVVNAQFFDPGSGCLMGTTRIGGRTVSDDGRRNGRGLIWGTGSDWRLSSAGMVASSPDGFQAGPTLVEGGRPVVRWRAERINPNASGAARRVALARSGRGRSFLVVTREGYTLDDFADLLVSMGAREAIGMDGGSSACLYYRGSQLVQPHRMLPGALAFDFTSPLPPEAKFERPIGTTKTSGLVSVNIDDPMRGNVVWLREDLDVISQVEALGAAVVCSPDVFDPSSNRPMGALRSGGHPIGSHTGPPVGYSWAFAREGFIVARCRGRHLGQGSVGGCGPLLCWKGEAVALQDQGYTTRGGMLGRARRLALALDRNGMVQVLASPGEVTPEEFV
ncbi:MAG: phosphodiester glycosidase family protein, partial [Candidatus Eremiobacteraeota bacterium]|nr:phosphodiester glycosidase family protein [Candidatus Eremiobacteraeota bacterium]